MLHNVDTLVELDEPLVLCLLSSFSLHDRVIRFKDFTLVFSTYTFDRHSEAFGLRSIDDVGVSLMKFFFCVLEAFVNLELTREVELILLELKFGILEQRGAVNPLSAPLDFERRILKSFRRVVIYVLQNVWHHALNLYE